MSATIRLTRKGRNKKPFYRIVVTDSRSPRDGRFIEILGTYNTLTDPATIQIKAEKAKDWVGRGVKISDTVREIFKKEGIFSQSNADTKQP